MKRKEARQTRKTVKTTPAQWGPTVYKRPPGGGGQEEEGGEGPREEEGGGGGQVDQVVVAGRWDAWHVDQVAEALLEGGGGREEIQGDGDAEK
jgi:hypothetical protein